jgi:hypothetical protein
MQAYVDCLNATPQKCTHLAHALLPYARENPLATFKAFVDVARFDAEMLWYVFVSSQFLALIFVLPLWAFTWLVGKRVARVWRNYPIAVTIMVFSFVVGLKH